MIIEEYPHKLITDVNTSPAHRKETIKSLSQITMKNNDEYINIEMEGPTFRSNLDDIIIEEESELELTPNKNKSSKTSNIEINKNSFVENFNSSLHYG